MGLSTPHISVTHVCFDCRRAVRRPQHSILHEAPRCATCQKPMRVLYTSTRIPKRSDEKGWAKLRQNPKLVPRR